MTVIVAPTEPVELRALGQVTSLLPERYGADVLWSSLPHGLCGVQRKTVTDFVASATDGRLALQARQLQRLAVRVLMLEGYPRWSLDGELMHSHVRWHRRGHRNLLRSLAADGIWVEVTDDLTDTVKAVRELIGWCAKGAHRSLHTRPGPAKDDWGRISNRDYGMHFLQGLDGVGPDAAGRIIDHFGRVPVQWCPDVDVIELCKIDGIGPATAEKLITALGGTVPPKPRRRKRTLTGAAGPTP